MPVYQQTGNGQVNAEPGQGEGGCAEILLGILASICSSACKDTPFADMFQQPGNTQAGNNPNVPDGIVGKNGIWYNSNQLIYASETILWSICHKFLIPKHDIVVKSFI